ncbi:MAG: hypothetical protein ACJAT3_001417 [Akkermansiaceae bacterium]|jgi:hypothetical protein
MEIGPWRTRPLPLKKAKIRAFTLMIQSEKDSLRNSFSGRLVIRVP